ncbi:MAG TPA: tetratricopeptide repeat protein [Gemmatimonadaceae bacterium]|nr:tetratricopeptide repeat protein [Gemmatimonadaceae bacterium]
MKRWTALTPAVLLAAGGCLASKSDIRLLQDELRATRAQLAGGDTAILRADQSRARQIEALSSSVERVNDSVRVLASRLASLQANSAGEFDAIGKQVVRIEALLGENIRNLQNTQAQLQALREQSGGVPAAAPVAPATPGTDTTQQATGPGAATLFITARQQLQEGATASARRNFEQLLASYPNDDRASRAQLYIGESYAQDGNSTAADSVYLLVAQKYPTSPEAATGLYRHGKMLWDANKKTEARKYLERVARDYPNSDEARLANDLLHEKEE